MAQHMACSNQAAFSKSHDIPKVKTVSSQTLSPRDLWILAQNALRYIQLIVLCI